MVKGVIGFLGVIIILLVSVAPGSAPPFTIGETLAPRVNTDELRHEIVGEFSVPKYCYGAISTSECIDTDGGLNYVLKGKVAGFEDVCSPFDDQILTEYTAEVDEIDGSCTAVPVNYECDSLCEDGRCLPPTCDDWIQNQGETGIDCGGPCDTSCVCPSGYKCVTGFDAEEKFGEGSFETSSDAVCGSEMVGDLNVAKYCYRAVSMSECIDTDGGVNTAEKGSVAWCEDRCNSDQILEECFIADKDEINDLCSIKSQAFDCNSLCDEGRCLAPTCYDLIQNQGETGVDSGGPCPTSVSCTWCGDNVEPIYVRGQYDQGFIDIVFVPELTYQGKMSKFIMDAKRYIREGYFKLDEWAIDPIASGYKDKFNFYYYTGGFGDLPSGTCAGELPSGFWSENNADFADIAGILRDVAGNAGCATGGPPGHFQSRASIGVVMHETGHVLFGLADNYCGCRAGYGHAKNIQPNLWSSLASCQSDASNAGWTLGSCVSICETNMAEQGGALSECQAPNTEKDFNYWQYDPDPSMMGNPPGARPIGEAATRRINYVFNNWPSGSTKGILIWLNIKDNKITEISSETTDAHPDIGFEQDHFRVDLLSKDSRLIKSFDLWDPRITMDGDFVDSDDVNFPVRFPWYKNLNKVSISDKSSGELMITVDLTDMINDYCAENIDDADCKVELKEEKPTTLTTTTTVVETPSSTKEIPISEVTTTTVVTKPSSTDEIPVSVDKTLKTSNLVYGLILVLLLVIVYLATRLKGQKKK
jgi:hypothetical protein